MTRPICTTLNAIRAHNPCADRWAKLLAYLGKTGADDEPLSLVTILDSNGLADALWALRAVTGHDREIRRYAVWCARQVQHLMTDPRNLAALDVAERHADGLATDDELAAARDSAWFAAASAVASAAARDAASAAARYFAWPAARDSAWFAASAAASAVARDGAWDAASAAARAVAWDAAAAAQAAEFRRVFGGAP
jgi:hypothetical protein